MANDLIIAQRGSDTAPALSGFDEITNPLHPGQRLSSRFAHFSEGVYDISPETHLAKLLKVLLGDVGVGQLHKRMLLVRLQQILGGTHFFDLDSFYGSLFGVNRRAAEQLLLDPFRQSVTQASWDQLRVRDGSYRSRAEQFARSIGNGATVAGLEQAAEAMLNVDCEIREGWTIEDVANRTYANVEALGTYGTIEGTQSWLTLEQGGTARPLTGRTRHLITVIPKRDITPEERFDVTRVLERLKPAGSIIEVIASPPQVFKPVDIQVLAADSVHWEVRTQIANTVIEGQYLYGSTADGYIESPTTPWANYQGEAFTLLALSPATVALTIPDGNLRMDNQFSPSAQDLQPESFRLPSGDSVTFLSRYAMRSPQNLYGGRLLSDGVLSANPYSGTRDQASTSVQVEGGGSTNVGFTTTAAVNIDGSDLDVISSIDLLKDSINRQNTLFWTGPLRAMESPVVDTIEVRFNTPQTFNLLSAEITHFPHQFEVHAWDSRAGIWRTLLTQIVRDSVPFSVNGALPPGAVHPYHFGENHWISVKQRVPNTTTDIVRFVFRRALTQGLPPYGVDGKPTEYPLAVRNIDIGYRVTSLDGIVPSNDPLVPLVASSNAVGQPTRHFITRYPASNVIGNGEPFWKSQPQPVGEAVVNLYLDMRSGSGAVPVVDRFYLDPLTSGPSFNLYYSAGAPTIDLKSSVPQDSDLFPISIVGNIRLYTGGDEGLLWPVGSVGYLDFGNDDLQFTPTQQSWWVGASLIAQAPSNGLSRATVLSFGPQAAVGDVAVSFDADVLKLTWLAQTVTIPAVFANGDRLDIVASFRPQADGTVIMNGYVSVNRGAYTTATATYSGGAKVARPSTVRVGHTASNDTAVDSFPFRVLGLNVHYGDGTAEAANFRVSPDSYRETPNPDDRVSAVALGNSFYDHTLGALLRFDASFIRPGISVGFIGGQPDIYSSLSWKPIARDFTLRKGYIKVPPTAGAIWKFEFSGLTPEPFETFLAIPRTVKLFTGAASAASTGGVTWDDDMLTALSLASLGRFADMPAITTYTSPYVNTTPPTLAISAPDPQGASDLRSRRGFPYNALAFQPPHSIAQYVQTGVHTYNVVQVDHVNKVGFFVGLRQVVAYRADFGVPENTTTYVDHFWDLNNITSGMTMLADTNVLYTPSNPSTAVLPSARTATSRVLPSYIPVEAVQFATQQSAPVSIVPDENFRDPALPTSPFTDTNAWHFNGDAHVFYDGINKAVKVSRSPDILRTMIGTNGMLVHPPVTPVLTTTPVWTTAFNPSAQGGLASGQVPCSAGGALHAAVRLQAPKALSGALTIQIVGSNGTTVLAESSFTPTAGVITEQVLNYRLGQNAALEGSVEIRIVQKGGFTDEWFVYSFALFDDSILWEWSNDGGVTFHPAIDVRNNDSGVLRFSQPGCGLRYRVTCYRYNTAINMMKIKPWYQGRVLGRHATPQRGPNMSVFDDDIPIQDDPDFTTWTNPVPREWFARYKSLLIETSTQYGDSLFARSLSRTAAQTGLVVTDTATRTATLFRGATDSAVVGDSATRTGTFARSAGDTVTVTDGTAHPTRFTFPMVFPELFGPH